MNRQRQTKALSQMTPSVLNCGLRRRHGLAVYCGPVTVAPACRCCCNYTFWLQKAGFSIEGHSKVAKYSDHLFFARKSSNVNISL